MCSYRKQYFISIYRELRVKGIRFELVWIELIIQNKHLLKIGYQCDIVIIVHPCPSPVIVSSIYCRFRYTWNKQNFLFVVMTLFYYKHSNYRLIVGNIIKFTTTRGNCRCQVICYTNTVDTDFVIAIQTFLTVIKVIETLFKCLYFKVHKYCVEFP